MKYPLVAWRKESTRICKGETRNRDPVGRKLSSNELYRSPSLAAGLACLGRLADLAVKEDPRFLSQDIRASRRCESKRHVAWLSAGKSRGFFKRLRVGSTRIGRRHWGILKPWAWIHCTTRRMEKEVRVALCLPYGVGSVRLNDEVIGRRNGGC